jgi:hypothetical protein
MNQRRRKTRNGKENSGVEKQHRDLPRIAVPWGRGASEYRPGLFTKQYFEKHGEEPVSADIYYALSEEIRRSNDTRVTLGEKAFERPSYSSFAKYFHWFKLLGLIGPVDRLKKEERSHRILWDVLTNIRFCGVSE